MLFPFQSERSQKRASSSSSSNLKDESRKHHLPLPLPIWKILESTHEDNSLSEEEVHKVISTNYSFELPAHTLFGETLHVIHASFTLPLSTFVESENCTESVNQMSWVTDTQKNLSGRCLRNHWSQTLYRQRTSSACRSIHSKALVRHSFNSSSFIKNKEEVFTYSFEFQRRQTKRQSSCCTSEPVETCQISKMCPKRITVQKWLDL